MKIGLIGYGKMGREVELSAKESGATIAAIIPSKANFEKLPQEVEVWIDFSHPTSTLEIIDKISTMGKPLVVGTTGWYTQLPEVKQLIQTRNTALFYAPNFSSGVYHFLTLLKKAAALFCSEDKWDVAISEIHHREKVDAPSGTARAMQQLLNSPEAASVRIGTQIGTHTAHFDSPTECLTFTHTAKSRRMYALGALKAAFYVKDKRGIFTMEDLFPSC